MTDLVLVGTILLLALLAWAFILACGALMDPVDVRPPSDETKP